MRVDCWDCKFFDYEEFYDGEEETRLYVCKHPKGTGHCPLSKIAPDECALLDECTVQSGPSAHTNVSTKGE